LIDFEGNQVGVIDTSLALNLANEAGLDLVEVSPDSEPPVARILDYGKMRYEASIREKEARKNQGHIVTKEIKLRPRIDQHDLDIKVNQVRKFLGQGNRVRITLQFRGREQSHPEIGYKLLAQVQESLSDVSSAESAPLMDGRNVSILLLPVKPAS